METGRPEGILLVDKPPGCTSHDVVDRIRKHFRIKKVGHAGTLDPLATGLLVLLLGRWTKQAQRFIGLDKEYEGTFRFGAVTDTWDADGKVLEERPVPDDLEARIREHLDRFRGTILQRPPNVSAIKKAGKPLYKYARKGNPVEADPREVTIREIELTGVRGNEADIRVACSTGTYIRSIAYDLGEAVGCGAHQAVLRRTRVGDFRIEDARALDELIEVEPGNLPVLRPSMAPNPD